MGVFFLKNGVLKWVLSTQKKMIQVGYYFLYGTNVEVGVRQVSACGKFAKITYRYGKQKYMHLHKWKAAKKMREARRHVEAVVPCRLLSRKSSFVKNRGVIKKKFKRLPHLDPHFDMKKKLFICGAIKADFKKFDEKTGVLTFSTTPVRKAHISVMSNTLVTPTFQKRLLESGFLKGTNIPVKMLNECPRISLYRFGNDAAWIPHSYIVSGAMLNRPVKNATPIGVKYLYGFLQVEAYLTEFEDVFLLRLPGKTLAESWAKKEEISDELAHPYLFSFKEKEKLGILADQLKRKDSLQPLV